MKIQNSAGLAAVVLVASFSVAVISGCPQKNKENPSSAEPAAASADTNVVLNTNADQIAGKIPDADPGKPESTNAVNGVAAPGKNQEQSPSAKEKSGPEQQSKTGKIGAKQTDKSGSAAKTPVKLSPPPQPAPAVKMVDLTPDEIEPAGEKSFTLKRAASTRKDFQLLWYANAGMDARKFKADFTDISPVLTGSGYKNGYYRNSADWAVDENDADQFTFTLVKTQYEQTHLNGRLEDSEYTGGFSLESGARLWFRKNFGVSAGIRVLSAPMSSAGDWNNLGISSGRYSVYDYYSADESRISSDISFTYPDVEMGIESGRIVSNGVYPVNRTGRRRVLRDYVSLDSASVDAETYGIEAVCTLDFRVWKRLSAFVPVGAGWNKIRTEGLFSGMRNGTPYISRAYGSDSDFVSFAGIGFRYDVTERLAATARFLYYFDTLSSETASDAGSIRLKQDRWNTSVGIEYEL